LPFDFDQLGLRRTYVVCVKKVRRVLLGNIVSAAEGLFFCTLVIVIASKPLIIIVIIIVIVVIIVIIIVILIQNEKH